MTEDMLGRPVFGGSIGLIIAILFLITFLIVRSQQQKAVPRTSELNTPVAFDMYGIWIYPLGETGFGIAVWFVGGGQGQKTRHPYFTLFHQSDGYRQALFSASMSVDAAYINISFREHIVDYFANQTSLSEAPSLSEDRS